MRKILSLYCARCGEKWDPHVGLGWDTCLHCRSCSGGFRCRTCGAKWSNQEKLEKDLDKREGKEQF